MTNDEALAPGPDPAGAPVFVDASGRRARRIRRLATIVVLGCLGYGMALLIAALTGVPIEGAIVPFPAIGAHAHSDRPADNPTSQPTGPGLIAPASGGASPSAGPGLPRRRPSKRATPTRAATTTTTAHPTGSPTTTATPTHGKTTSAPGVTRRPTSQPTVAATSHGRALRP